MTKVTSTEGSSQPKQAKGSPSARIGAAVKKIERKVKRPTASTGTPGRPLNVGLWRYFAITVCRWSRSGVQRGLAGGGRASRDSIRRAGPRLRRCAPWSGRPVAIASLSAITAGSDNGQPNRVPFCFAAAMPALTRSRISSRSYSARVASMLNISRPAEVAEIREPRGSSLQTQGGGGVVGPGRLDADVGAEGGQGSVAGLVGDGAVAGSA